MAHTAAIALVIAAITVPARIGWAETVAETVRAWELVGKWSPDCSRPPTERNGQDIYFVTPAGRVGRDRDFGRRYDRKEVKQALARSDGLELIVYCPQSAKLRQITLIKAPDGRLRTMTERDVDTEEYTIKDGKFAATGADTPWKMRCFDHLAH
jgi:hypothetical protein